MSIYLKSRLHPKNIILIFYETIKEAYPQLGFPTDVDLNIPVQQTLLHEIGHALTLEDDESLTATGGVMNTKVYDPLDPNFQKFLLSDIQKIQKNSKVQTEGN